MHSEIQEHIVLFMVLRLLRPCHSAKSAPATQQACVRINLTHSTLYCALMSRLSALDCLIRTGEQTRHGSHQPVVSVELHAPMMEGTLPIKVTVENMLGRTQLLCVEIAAYAIQHVDTQCTRRCMQNMQACGKR